MRFLKQIETLFHTGTSGGLTDGQLLECFLERRDEHAEAAFAALVDRHGAMVLRVCRQILRSEDDAEDAAQATFLVLARRAGTIGRRESVSCWLHGVALRVAAKARTAATRRRTHEQRGGEMRTAGHVVERDLQAVEDHDDRAALHQELDQLPKSFREPLILCYLDGLSQEQAAAQLRCPLGTIQSRLSRGRAKLKARFEKRGVSLSGMLVGAGQSTLQSGPPSQVWAEATVRLAMQFVQAKGPAIAGAGAASLVLAEEVLRTIVLAKTKVAAAVLMCGACVAAAAWAIHERKSDAPPAVATNFQPGNEQPAAKLTLQAIDASTGKPIEAVSVDYICVFGEERRRATIFTGEDGTVAIEWPAGAIVRRLWITARAPDRVPIDILWEHERGPVALPVTEQLRFEPGTIIGGILRDEAGHPVAGAAVKVGALGINRGGQDYWFSLGSASTDAQGRWRFDVAPKDLKGLWVQATHPHFRKSDVVASRNLDSVTILKKGLSVLGRVVDAAGSPVPRATAVLGDIWGSNRPSATTDEQGRFTLENGDAGPSVITVQAEGFAPRIQDVRVDAQTAPVEFQLLEPGALLRCRVVDVNGNPVAGAMVYADSWRGHRSIRFQTTTDAQGRFQWQSAPKDVVHYTISKHGMMSPRDVPLAASEREQTFVLYPELVITGRVTDAETRRPVPKVRVVKGWRSGDWERDVYWDENRSDEFADGKFTCSFDSAREAHFVRIEAPGYALAVSRAFKPEEGRQVLDFALQRASGITGVVCLPDGKPASGADVGLSTWQTQVRLRFGKFDPNANFPKASTGSDGRFSFPPRSGEFFVVALTDTGYAEATSDELARSGKLVLQAWGRIEGGVRTGARFGPNQEILFHPIRPQRDGSLDSFGYGYWMQTDERGRFQFDRVVPGPGTVARVVRDDPRPLHSFRQLECWPERIEVKPGETAQVTLGGKGRPVIGRIVLDGTPEAPIDWTLNLPVMLGVPPEKSDPKRFGLLTRGSALFAAHINKDGRFRIDDVPAGKYELELEVGEDPSLFDRVKQTVVVPAFAGDRSDEPFDLGTITAKVRQGIKIGDLAPDFDVECIGTDKKGRRLKLRDYRGKLVLLNFWQAQAGRQNDMTVLKEVQASFGHDPRLVLISLACGKSAAQAEQSIKQDGLNWTHGFAGDFVTGAATRYEIRAIYQSQFIIGPDQKKRQIPLTFLIGPDGRIVAHNMSGNDPGAVGKALENPKLFPRGGHGG